MKIKIRNELIPLNLLVIVLIIAITLFPFNGLRIALGLPFLLFFPGYTLVAALFVKREGMGAIERITLSFGMSIAVVSLIGLILNYTPWGIRLYTVLISVTIFILTTSVVAWYQRRRLPEAERPTVSLNLSLARWRGQSFVDKILSIILIAAILGAAGTLSYVIATPKVGEKFTEFYVLGLEGKPENYPKGVVVEEEAKVIVRIVNNEHETVSYRLEVRIDGVRSNEVGPLVLGHDEAWEDTVSFTPYTVGNNQKVEFLLYKSERGEPYLKPIHLWINVKEPG